jgi:hypothetical protein
MSTLKTPDNATLPAPNVSRGRELRPQEARGSKMAATAQSRGADWRYSEFPALPGRVTRTKPRAIASRRAGAIWFRLMPYPAN